MYILVGEAHLQKVNNYVCQAGIKTMGKNKVGYRDKKDTAGSML